MIELNDALRVSLGLGALSHEDGEHFLSSMRSRVDELSGLVIAHKLSDYAHTELGYFIDQNMFEVHSWLDENYSLNDTENLKTVLAAYAHDCACFPDPVDINAFICEYGTLLWLQLNCPDYQQIIEAVFEDLCEEVRSDPQRIIDYYTRRAKEQENPLY